LKHLVHVICCIVMVNIYVIMVYYVWYIDYAAYDSVRCMMLVKMCWKWWTYAWVKIIYCCLSTSGSLSVNPWCNYKIEWIYETHNAPKRHLISGQRNITSCESGMDSNSLDIIRLFSFCKLDREMIRKMCFFASLWSRQSKSCPIFKAGKYIHILYSK
jgi:hypothetical protein